MERLRRWWKYSWIRDTYYNIENGVRNLIVYFPLIWRTRDWDYIYIYEFLQFKIKKHRELLERNRRHIGVDKDIHQMRVCELLIERLRADDYMYDKTDWTTNRCAMTIRYYHPLSPSRENFNELFKYEKRRKQQDKELLFKIMMKHGDSWWD